MTKKIKPLWLAVAGLLLLNLGAIGYFASKKDSAPRDDESPRGNIALAELLKPGPLEEMTLGDPNAPNVIIEYASMTCPHCAAFHKDVFPALKARFIDTGKARFIFREFPLDNLAASAFMLARCSGKDQYFAAIDALFMKQEDWVEGEGDAKPALLATLKDVGSFTNDSLDNCLKDEALFKKIVEVRRRANEEYQVSSTPSFFVNGKALDHPESADDFAKLLSD